MKLEIERKFLVTSDVDFLEIASNKFNIEQYYFSTDDDQVVRLRIQNEKAILGFKKVLDGDLRKRFEYEIEIPKVNADEIIQNMSFKGSVVKTRYEIPMNNLKWEIDVFRKDNQGLVVAEIEVPNLESVIEKPEWIGQEVSNDSKYLNVNLLKKPYKLW